jgi:hypothetical protein
MRISFNVEAGGTSSSSALDLVYGAFKNLSSKQARNKLKVKLLEEIVQINLLQ